MEPLPDPPRKRERGRTERRTVVVSSNAKEKSGLTAALCIRYTPKSRRRLRALRHVLLLGDFGRLGADQLVLKAFPQRSGEVEAVQVHDLGPRLDEVIGKLFLGVRASIDFRDGA
jgi:hypothetical protein